MKVKVLMATLVITLLVGVQGFANPCDSVCCDPCAACGTNGGNLFFGLKKLVSGVRCNPGCDPCDPIVACTPCDEVCSPCDNICGPCDDVCCTPKFNFRKLFSFRLRGCNDNDCDPCGPCGTNCEPCDPCGTNCGPCDPCCDPCDPCGTGCGPKFNLRKLFSFRLRGCNDNDCGPCDNICGPCDDICGPCDADCGPCDDVCGNYCGPRGHLFDLPRIKLTKLFGGFGRCNDGCDPCGIVQPCDSACCR